MRIAANMAAGLILSCCETVCVAEDLNKIPLPYEDRLIVPGTAGRDQDDDEAAMPDQSGLPRALIVGSGVADTAYGSQHRREAGLNAAGFWDTLTWGSWSLDAVLRSGDSSYGGSGSSFTLWQRAVPFAGGWVADNGLGVINAPSLPLMRSGYRFLLPVPIIAGVETDWRRDNGMQLQAALGEPGYFSGGRWSAYHPTGGQLGQAAAQWAWSPQWSSAIALSGLQDALPWWAISAQGSRAADVTRVDGQSAYAATSWRGEATQLQVNLLTNRSGGTTHGGIWADAVSDVDYYRQHYGLFHLDSDLAWSGLPFTNDIEGGYYRVEYQRAQWNWSAGADQVHSLSGGGVDGTYLNGNLRYQARPWVAVGADAILKPGGDAAYSADLFVDWRTRWGNSRVQLQEAQNRAHLTSRQITWDQSLPTREGTHLSIATSIASADSPNGGVTRSESVAAYGSYHLSGTFSLDGNLRWTRGQGPEGQRGFDGNVSANWQLSKHWAIAATYYRSEASQRSVFIIDPIAQATPFISLPRTWAYSLSLRYERHAGSPAAVLGGSMRSGVGVIASSVFLDRNGNARRDAGELGAANITVLLDGRYSTRTDASGHCEFPAVSAGEHHLTVIPDNLPLPWTFDERASNIRVMVEPRDVVTIEIAAKQMP